MEKIIKIILTILLFCCVSDMSYSYYQFIRFVAMVMFSYLVYYANLKKRNNEVIIYIGLALLFQPFIKVALGRLLWNIVDLIVGIGLLLSLIQKNEKSN